LVVIGVVPIGARIGWVRASPAHYGGALHCSAGTRHQSGRAWLRSSNMLSSKSSSRMRLCKDSTNPPSHVWPGGVNAWSVSCSLAQRPKAPAMNSARYRRAVPGVLHGPGQLGQAFRSRRRLPCAAQRTAGLGGFARAHAQPLGAPQAPERITAHDNALALGPRPGAFSPSVDAWRQNRSSTGAQAHDHAAFSPRPPRGCGNTLTGTARQRARARR